MWNGRRWWQNRIKVNQVSAQQNQINCSNSHFGTCGRWYKKCDQR